MKLPIAPILPKRPTVPRPAAVATSLSQWLVRIAATESSEVLQELQTTRSGLSDAEAERRIEDSGPNTVGSEKGNGWLQLLARAFLNPLVVLLSALAIISFVTGDIRAAVVITLMVVMGVVLRFV